MVKNSPTNAGDIEIWVRALAQEDPLEEGMATHSSILAWRIPWIVALEFSSQDYWSGMPLPT